MNDSQPPSDPDHDLAPREFAPSTGATDGATSASEGPAGWPGSIHAEYTAPAAEPAPAHAPSSLPPPVPTPPPPPAPPPAPTPPPPVVHEVVAVPITAAERRGPTIEVPTSPRAEPTIAPSVPSTPAAEAAPSPVAPAPPPTGAAHEVFAASAAPAAPSIVPPPMAPIAPASPAPAGAAASPSKHRIWAILAHLAYLIPFHIPGIVVTVLIWVWRRKQDPLAEDQGREALNFQLTYLALNTLLGVTCMVFFIPVVWVAGAVLCVVAAVRASDGLKHRYPAIFRLIA